MGMYERIINNKKKEEEQFEQESMYERITGEKNYSSNSASLNYNKQKRVLESAQKRYRTELNKEYEKQGVFNFSLPTSNRNNISLIDKLTSSQNNYTEQKLTTNPFTPKENLKKIKTAQDNVSELKNVVDEEYNKLKYANYLKNVEKVQNEDTTLWDKTGGVIQRAITDLASSLGTDKYTYTDENGNKVHLPNYSELKQEKVSNDYNTGIGKFIFNDVLYNTSKILGSTAINTLAPGVGTFTYWQDMFMDNYKNTINQGYDNTKALAYSSVNTAFEYITGKFLGSATKGLTGGKISELSNMVSNVTNRIINNPKISSVIGNMGSEAAEEFLQEYLDNASRLLVLGEDIDLTSTDILEDALYSAAVGGLSGGLIGSIDNSSSNNAKNNIKVYTEFKKALEETKSKTTDVDKVNEIDNLIKKVDNYIKNPFTEKNITNEVEPALNALKKQTTNQEVNAPTLNQNINPLENLKEFNQKQQEIKNQQFQKETTSRISELQNQVEELQESSFNLDKNAIQYNDLQQSQNIEFSKNSTGDIKVILKDANGNIVNDFTLISEKQVTKSLGTDIGNYIINNANNEVQSINISQNEQANKQPTTFKEKQLDIINKTNPMNDEYHVGIRNIDDIKTFDEVINDEESFVWGDYTKEDALRDLQKGTVTVYSSYPIENGAFVSTSKIQAQEYAGGQGSKVYSKIVPLNEIAWINGDEGQYAKVKEKIPTYKDFQQKVNLPTVNQNNVNEKINNHVVSEETINKYENATGTIDRNTLLEVADTLDIHYKEGATIIIDENMIKKAGNNKNPQIIDVSMFNRIGDLSQLTREVNNLSRDLYANNENGYTLVDNIDTNTNFELGRLGIDKTFSKNVPIEKLPTFNKLKEIGEQGLYYRTTYNSNENDGILYHHFLTPVKAINTDGNAFIRTVIKEYTKDNNMNNKFYYHQMEYLDNQKGTTDTSHIGTRTFGNSLYDNNTTNLTKSQIAPLPSQYSMQQNVENDTKIPSYKDFSKVMNPNEISQLTMEDANTTPLLPKTKRNNQNASEESSFYKNITEKSKFLTEENRGTIGNEEDVQYYKGITNEDTLNEAKTKLDNGGMAETLNWFNRNKVDSNGKMKHNPTAVDVAEGWILLKQYQDAGDYDSMVEVAKTMRKIGTQAGQTVQAYNIMARLTPEGMVKYAQSELSEAYEQMCKNKTKEWIDSNRDKFNLTTQEVQAIVEIMKKVQTMEDGYNKKVELAKIQKIMTDKLPPERGAGIKAWMRISMLFNPKTQVRNVMGNAVIAPVNYFSDLFSSAVDSMVAKKTGYRTTGITNIGNYVKGFKKGAFESYNDFKKGINTRNIEGNRFEITEGKSFNDNTSIGKALNKVDSLLGFMLDVGDRTFYEATFTNSINNQMKLNNTDTVTQEMIDIATQEALSRTWQDNNNYTRFVLNVRKMMNNINVKGYGLGDVLIPFAKTPANLTKAIVDYSPLGLIQTINDGVKLNRSLSNGQYNTQMQHKFVQDLGKATMGTMLYVLGIALAKAGITSGESDDDKDVANFMKNTLGVSSYSIKIGNKTFTYDWAQPLAAPLSITANIVKNQKEGANLYENIMSSLNTAGNILLEQSFLDSLNTVLSNNDGIATGIQESILELPSRAIPTFAKQITDLTDGTQRTTFEKDKPLETAFNKIKAKIPGLSQTLVPTKDTLGRNIQKYGGKNNIFNVFLNPANVNTENISSGAEEIYRVYKATGEKSIMPRVPEYKYKDEDGNVIILNSKQRAKYQEVSGKIVEDNVEKLLKTTEYKKLTDIEKAEVLNNIVNYSYNVAKNEVLGLKISQAYEKAHEYSKIGNISDYYTFKANIDNTDSETKKESISSYLINSNLNNKQLAYLYESYYSSKEKLDSLLNANIPIKEFIKFNSQDFESDFNTKTGKTVSGSREKKVINYVNSLNLSIPQKALLIKMEYKSYDKYDKQIAEYVNSQNISFLDKAQILKKANFTSFDKQIINYVNSQSMTIAEKTEILEDLGFTYKNGRVY